jgi:hypothetical protein
VAAVAASTFVDALLSTFTSVVLRSVTDGADTFVPATSHSRSLIGTVLPALCALVWSYSAQTAKPTV